jgi:HEPN domain-containing protein
LIEEASQVLLDMSSALERGSWNLAIRRAQEVVELVLKALLAEMGADYPKIHDVGRHFATVVGERGIALDKERLTWLADVSQRLTSLRAPAFYFETEFDEQEARRAAAEAEEVMAFAADFRTRLGSI